VSPSPDPPAEGERASRTILVGETPDAAHVPSGCRFHPRCPLAFDRCKVEEPPLFDVGEGHRAACWLAEAGPLDLPVIDAVQATGGSEAAAVEVGVSIDATGGALPAATPDDPAA
jgi:oligopeptide/dipeptide ABC transporter ATP-binding protein